MRIVVLGFPLEQVDWLRHSVWHYLEPQVEFHIEAGFNGDAVSDLTDLVLWWMDNATIAQSDLRGALDRFGSTPTVLVNAEHGLDVKLAGLRAGARDVWTIHEVTVSALTSLLQDIQATQSIRIRAARRLQNLQNFAHVVVHDLRAPLRSIRGGIEMLREDMSAREQALHDEPLSFVFNGADRMDAMLRSLYEYNCLENPEAPLDTVDLQALVADVRANLSADIRGQDNPIRTETPLPRVPGDYALLLRLFQNLVSNALKFNTSQHPQVTFSGTETREFVEIEISDNGIGIAEADIQAIFEPFRRLHAEEKFEGTGLGLSICRRIAAHHGAELTCRSTPGEGSVFTIRFPLPDRQQERTANGAFAMDRHAVARAL